mmetsp:Transcript_29446/g.83045  ORF Transcript_29446/g.83045 Transcript_29446/m.83045 type:complete len:96 (+) Transcript_29446:808-1095(+)
MSQVFLAHAPQPLSAPQPCLLSLHDGHLLESGSMMQPSSLPGEQAAEGCGCVGAEGEANDSSSPTPCEARTCLRGCGSSSPPPAELGTYLSGCGV